MIRKVLFAAEISWLVLGITIQADASATNASISVAFTNASVIGVLNHYEHTLHRTLQVATTVPTASITLRSSTLLTPDEYMNTITALLHFYGLTIDTNGFGQNVIQAWTNAPEGPVKWQIIKLLAN